MKCPNCGKEIADDKLYCEYCGAEFSIVDDVNLDMEIEMGNTLNNIAENEFGDEDYAEDEIEFEDDPTLIGMFFRKHKLGFVFYIIVLIMIGVALWFAIKLGNNISKQSTKEYKLEMAQTEVENGDLSEAISYLEAAYAMDKTDSDILFKIADYYYTMERVDDALYTLTDIANNPVFNEVVREKAYRKIISLYKEDERYADITKLLAECDLEVVKSEYVDYEANVPIFSYDEGTYEETIALKLSSEGNGTIYYTTDGSKPNTESEVYDSPLFFEYGSYTVSAMFVNEYGVSSDIVVKNYLIDTTFSFKPDVLTEPGDYDHATLVEVDVPSQYTVYYTTDGTEPDKTSNKYLYPVPLPLGNSTFNFVSYATDGTQSEVVTCDYCVSIDTEITPAIAVNKLNDKLVEMGILEDLSGKKPGVAGRFLYIYSAPYPFNGGQDFYLVVEYYEDVTGNTVRTNINYAVSCDDGSVYKVESKEGVYSLVDF